MIDNSKSLNTHTYTTTNNQTHAHSYNLGWSDRTWFLLIDATCKCESVHILEWPTSASSMKCLCSPYCLVYRVREVTVWASDDCSLWDESVGQLLYTMSDEGVGQLFLRLWSKCSTIVKKKKEFVRRGCRTIVIETIRRGRVLNNCYNKSMSDEGVGQLL